MLLLRQAVSHARLSVTKSQRALNVVGARAGRPYSTASNFRPSPRRTLLASSVVLLATFGTGWLAYEYHQPTRYAMLSVVRCSRVAEAAVFCAIDYKKTQRRRYNSQAEEKQALSECHTRSAQRVLRALLANGGIFIKMGQHISSLMILPVEWTSTMKPLQDRCEPTSYEDIDALFRSDIGTPIEELFDEFNRVPVGVASLAQVHVGRDRQTGREVAIKFQHPHLALFCDVDMAMVESTLGWIKFWFPEFEFTWLAGEMRENLPKEMDFTNEARNAQRAAKDFANVRTSLYIPEVLSATKRVLIMEYIHGARVDNLAYLAEHNIDRNKVALELARIFARMVHINGWFHADPHAGNLLIRPSPRGHRSRYNFDIVLLDHGLYFDLNDTLRVNYSRFWLSLIEPTSEKVAVDRRKYAELFGNIGPDLYPVFEAALTGRAVLQDTIADDVEATSKKPFRRASSMLDLNPQNDEELEAIRKAVYGKEGLLLSVLDVLRRVPRRVLMVFKLNDLTRSLDHALVTTHSNIRVFMVTARYCAMAVWRDDRRRLIDQMCEEGPLSWHLLWEYVGCWWRFEKTYRTLGAAGFMMDFKAWTVKRRMWLRGLRRGWRQAHEAAAGLD